MIGVNALGMYGGAIETLQDAVAGVGKQIDDANNSKALLTAQESIAKALKAIEQWQRVIGK